MLHEFPPEILYTILWQLSAADMSQLALVCPRFTATLRARMNTNMRILLSLSAAVRFMRSSKMMAFGKAYSGIDFQSNTPPYSSSNVPMILLRIDGDVYIAQKVRSENQGLLLLLVVYACVYALAAE